MLLNRIYQGTAYYRLSNDDGDLIAHGKSESNSISNQRSLIEDYLKDKPDIVLIQERMDDGYSGVDFERPAFKRMIADVMSKKTNCIIVKDLSRFGRNYIEVGRFLEQIFPSLGVRFIAVNDNYDSITANSTETHLMVPFKNLMNDSYSKDISTKVRSQFEIKRKQGDFIGSFAVYGYLKDEKNRNHLIVDEYAASIVSDIFMWKLDGKSMEQIAKRLNRLGVLSPAEYKKSLGLKYKTGFMVGKRAEWSALAVKRVLTNQTYLGYMVQGKKTTPNHKVKKVIEKKPGEWTIVKNKHQPIISEQVFSLVQKALRTDTRISPVHQEPYLFSGMVYCGDCMGSMVRKLVSAGKDKNGNVRKYPYLLCSTYKKNTGCCSSHLIRESVLEEAVLTILQRHMDNLLESEQITEMLNQKSAVNFGMKKLDIQILKMNEEINKFQSLKISLYEDLADGTIDKSEFFELKQHYIEQINRCGTQIQELKKEQERVGDLDYPDRKGIACILERGNLAALSRGIVLRLLDRIEVYGDFRIKVTFCFRYDYELALKAIGLYQQEEVAIRGWNKQGAGPYEKRIFW